MVVGILRITVAIPEANSLKDKRSRIVPLKSRIQNKFQASVAEVGQQDNLRRGELGIACVSTDARHADEVMARIADFAEANAGSYVVDEVHTEVLYLG